MPQSLTQTTQTDNKNQSGSSLQNAELEDIQNLCSMSHDDKQFQVDGPPPVVKKEPLSPDDQKKEELNNLRNNAQVYLRRYQDLEIETKCLVTKISGSQNQRRSAHG